MNDWNISEQAAALHRDALVWDMTLPWTDFGRRDLKLATLTRMAASGYDFVSLTLTTDDTSIEKTVRIIAAQRTYVRNNADKYVLVESVDDILRAKKEGKLALGFNFQGTEALGRNIDMVEVYYRLGVRQMLMAYNQKNSVGDGCHEITDAGLSRFGVQVVEEMNRVGMLVDCSHTGYRTTMDALKVSKAPVIFSHSNARALVDHPRAITDEQAKACAETGGVIGVVGVGIFLGDNEIKTELIVRQIDYYSELIGPQHIGIGLDYIYDVDTFMPFVHATPEMYPEGCSYEVDVKFAPPEQLPELTEGLLKRGYQESDIRGILGENWLRVARQVWK